VTPPPYSFTPLGQCLKSVRLHGFILTEAVYRPTFRLPKHIHDRAVMSIVLKGSYTEYFGHRPNECAPYSVLLKPVGIDHADQYGAGGARCLIVKVEPGRLEVLRSFSKVLDQSLHARDAQLAGLSVRLYKEFRLMDDASALSMEGLILEMLGHFTRHGPESGSSAAPHWLRTAEAMIREQPAERVGLVSVAAAVGVHPSHLARTFRKFYGCAVGEYLRRARLERAVQELALKDRPLVEVALASGFYDQSHFTRVFKARFGLTPSAFRASLRER
jgi:AraC family transcriptional regulator